MIDRQNLVNLFEKSQGSLEGHYRFTSDRTGPRRLIVFSLHGDEPCGAFAFWLWYQALNKKELAFTGEVDFLLGNPRAFLNNKRYLEFDLNRSFGAKENSSQEGQRAKEISNWLALQLRYDFVLDLHSVSQGSAQMAIFNHDVQTLDTLSSQTHLKTFFSYGNNQVKGVFLEEARKYTQNVLAIECGQHRDKSSIEVAYQQILKTLSLPLPSSFLEGRDFSSFDYYKTFSLLNNRPGFRFTKDFGQTFTWVTKNTPLGLSDEGEVYSPADCFLAMPSLKPRPEDRELGFFCHRTRE